jgi:hypothetical protein
MNNDLKGRGRGQIRFLSRNLPEGVDEHEQLQSE